MLRLDKNSGVCLFAALISVVTVITLDMRWRRLKNKSVQSEHVKVASMSGDKLNKIQDNVQFHQKMINSYLQDLHDFQRLNIPKTSNIMRFSHTQIAKLRQKLAQLNASQSVG